MALLSRDRYILLVMAIVSLLGLLTEPKHLMILIFSLFVLMHLFGEKIWQFGVAHLPKALVVVSTGAIVCFITESLAWLDNYQRGFENPGALFSTNYFEDLGIGFGFYLGMAVAWYFIARYFKFSTMEAFLTYGFFGVFLEQNAAIFLQAIAYLFVNPLASVYLVVVVFLAHAPILGLIHLRLKPLLIGTRNSIWKYPVAIVSIWVCAHLGTAVTYYTIQYLSK